MIPGVPTCPFFPGGPGEPLLPGSPCREEDRLTTQPWVIHRRNDTDPESENHSSSLLRLINLMVPA